MTGPAIYFGRSPHWRSAVTGSEDTAISGRSFAPKQFVPYVDVDAVAATLDPLPLWSARRPAVVRFRRSDYFDGGDGPLGEGIRGLVQQHLGRRPLGRVFLLAHFRTFGWLFNPLSIYYCWSPDETVLDAIVLEVTNTPWHERQWYVIDALRGENRSVNKAMYVSPFLPPGLVYQFDWDVPGKSLRFSIQVSKNGNKVFSASYALRRADLTRRTALTFLFRYPLMTLRVSGGIYWQALLLVLKRYRIYKHESAMHKGA